MLVDDLDYPNARRYGYDEAGCCVLYFWRKYSAAELDRLKTGDPYIAI